MEGKIAVAREEYERLLFYRKFFRNMNTAYFTLNIDEFEVDWRVDNGMVTRMFGITADEARAFGEMLTKQVKAGDDFNESYTRHIKYFKDNPDGKWSGVIRMMGLQGQSSWLIYSSTPFDYNQKGEVSKLAIIAIIVDDIFQTPLTLRAFRDYIIREVARKDVQSLSPKQLELLRLIAQNKTRIEIAEIMNISLYTVDDHKKAIVSKFGLKSKKDLVGLSQSLGLDKYKA